MAKILVRFQDTPGATGTKKWDVIDVREDSVEWGSREGYPTYLRVWLQGVTAADAFFLTNREYDDTGPVDLDTGEYTNKKYARAYHVLESRINPPTLAAIEAAWMVSGEFVVADGAGFLAFIEKKLDGSTPPAWGRQ